MKADEILRKNEFMLFLYLVLLFMLIFGIGYFITEISGLGMQGISVSLLSAFLASFVSYFFSDSIVIKSSKAHPVDEKAYADYIKLVRDMCEKNNIKMPRLYMINSNALNAFATGRNRDNAIVAVTKGLLQKLSPNEVRGVVAHELSHIQHGDIAVMSVIGVLAGFVSIFAGVLGYQRNLNKAADRENSEQNMIIAFLIAAVAPFTAALIKMAVSRTREYMADAHGGIICGNPNYLADALYKIKYDCAPPQYANDATAHLYIANPFKTTAFEKLMSTHPDIDDRINKLRNM